MRRVLFCAMVEISAYVHMRKIVHEVDLSTALFWYWMNVCQFFSLHNWKGNFTVVLRDGRHTYFSDLLLVWYYCLVLWFLVVQNVFFSDVYDIEWKRTHTCDIVFCFYCHSIDSTAFMMQVFSLFLSLSYSRSFTLCLGHCRWHFSPHITHSHFAHTVKRRFFRGHFIASWPYVRWIDCCSVIFMRIKIDNVWTFKCRFMDDFPFFRSKSKGTNVLPRADAVSISILSLIECDAFCGPTLFPVLQTKKQIVDNVNQFHVYLPNQNLQANARN